MLTLNNLTKKYSNKTAVNNISFEVNDGEICAFIGHNGAGKTTTLKCIAGIHSYNEGKIILNNLNTIDNELEYKKMLAYIPDNPEVYEFMTGNAYLNFICDVFNISKEDRINRIEKYSKDFEIYDVLPQLIISYSHGMKQKLVIVSALIHNPKLLILDEPFVGLDPVSSHKLKQIMHEFCNNGGTILFSTHILEVAEKLCDKVIIIKNGEIVANGKMETIKGEKSLEDIFLELK